MDRTANISDSEAGACGDAVNLFDSGQGLTPDGLSQIEQPDRPVACLLHQARSLRVAVTSVDIRFATADRFDHFLQSGVADGDDAMLTIMSLTDDEWPPFSLFVDQYSIDWQPYFTETMYVAYHREHDKRHWQPATTRFTRDDLRLPKLIVHFWAKWDAHDRTMDANLRPAITRFDGRVDFRSLDIDIPQLRDVCRDADAANVPSLAFYTNGHVDRLLVGVRDSDAIINEMETWLANKSPITEP